MFISEKILYKLLFVIIIFYLHPLIGLHTKYKINIYIYIINYVIYLYIKNNYYYK